MKKIGKIVLIAFVVLVVLGALSSACSNSSSKSDSSQAAASASSAQPSTESSDSGSSKDSSNSSTSIEHDPNIVGTWDMTEVKQGDTHYKKSELQNARAKGVDSYIVFNEDGTAILTLGDDEYEYTWMSADESTGLVSNSENAMAYSFDGNELVVGGSKNYFKFEKGAARTSPSEKDSDGKAESESDKDASAESGEVSPDLKEMLDSYEAFVDEYVEFMQKYQDSDDTTSMLSDYMKYMQSYAEFVQEVDDVDTDNLSAADYAYYIEVTSRISQKLIEASVL